MNEQEKIKTITLNDVEYVRKDEVENKQAEQLNGMDYCIVRTYSAGVFAGYVKAKNGQEVEIVKSRGIWYWDGACGLSQLAVDGTTKPENCQFTVEVNNRILTQVIEIIPCTEKAKKSIQGVKIWKK